MSRRIAGVSIPLVAVVLVLAGVAARVSGQAGGAAAKSPAQAPAKAATKAASTLFIASTANGEWPSYTGDTRGSRYSPLYQINASNFNKLEIAWRFKTDSLGTRPEYKLEGTPLMVGGVLYATGGTRRSVVALDATEEMLEKAKARCAKAGLHNVSFEHGDAENIPFPDSQFDGVVTRLAVHHFADPKRALDEMFRVLRPGAAAVIVDIVSSEYE